MRHVGSKPNGHLGQLEVPKRLLDCVTFGGIGLPADTGYVPDPSVRDVVLASLRFHWRSLSFDYDGVDDTQLVRMVVIR